MRGASIFSWKHLASVIHPPLPINRRDSQRLLSLMNTSFAQALDREHPKVAPTGRNTTDRHLNAILTSPHFESGIRILPARFPEPPSFRTTLKHYSTNDIRSITLAFKTHIAAGTASIDLAKKYLNAPYVFLNHHRQSGGAADIEALASMKIGSMVVNWMWSARLNWQSILRVHTGLLVRLIPLLIIEGRTGPVQDWLSRLRNKELCCSLLLTTLEGDSESIRTSQEALTLHTGEVCDEAKYAHVKSMVYYEDAIERPNPGVLPETVKQCRLAWRLIFTKYVINTDMYGFGLAESMKKFVAILASSSDCRGKRFAFGGAGIYLVDRILRNTDQAYIDRETYDAFMVSCQQWSWKPEFHTACLALRHPVTPSAEASYLWFKHASIQEQRKLSLAHMQRCLRLCLVAAEQLLSGEKRSHHIKAKEIMDVLEANFAEELGNLRKSAQRTSDGIDNDTDPLALLEVV
jgi:hypothetical protein